MWAVLADSLTSERQASFCFTAFRGSWRLETGDGGREQWRGFTLSQLIIQLSLCGSVLMWTVLDSTPARGNASCSVIVSVQCQAYMGTSSCGLLVALLYVSLGRTFVPH